MKLLLCITGTTGSGKSTLLDSLAMRGWSTISTGAMFRNMKREIEFGDTNNIAPESFDSTVEEEINKFLDKMGAQHGPCLCAIEAFPRKPEQINNLVEIGRRKGWIVICLALSASLSVRLARVSGRDLGQPDRLRLDENKIVQEEDVWPSFITTLKECGVPTFEVDTTKSQRTLSNGDSSISHIMDVVSNYYHHRTGRRVCIHTAKSMIGGIVAEAGEAIKSDTQPEMVEELIDVLWYTICAMVSLGVTSDYVVQMFNNKASINFHRLSSTHKPHVHNMEEEQHG